eukprot:7016034-Prorocentrum_lima.AAC.1
MTSSLVGSEMCIRDRTMEPRPRIVVTGYHGVLEWSPLACKPVQQDTAVSYTHLTLPTICSV